MEIERKWLFKSEDVLKRAEDACILYRQAYISTEPEVRIRGSKIKYREGVVGPETYKLAIKSTGTLSREEIQKSLSSEEFEALKRVGNLTNKDFIKKKYWIIPIHGYELTVGVVMEGTDKEFWYGEIEFETEVEANAFNPPEWFGEDVTNKQEYKMKNVWKKIKQI